ncbi:MAG: Hint domain-containing protein [Pseudomonadota bacterium]
MQITVNTQDDGLGTLDSKTNTLTNVVPCFTPGTVIATPVGEKRVEDLAVGDRVLTRDNGLQEVRWIGSSHLTARDLEAAPELRPVLIRSGALEHGLPEADIVVSPWHNVLIQSQSTRAFFDENEVLAAAGDLTDLEGVDVADVADVTYIHFMFDRHEVVLSNGFWSESLRPDDAVIASMGLKQRREIFQLFPELRDIAGRKAYQSARRALTGDECRLLTK